MARQGDEWPHHPQLSPLRLTALPTAPMPVIAGRLGIIPCKDEPQNAPSSPCNAGGAIRRMKPDRHKQNTRQRPPQSSFAAPFRPHLRRTAHAGQAKRRSANCIRGPSHHGFRSPRPHQIDWGTGLFMSESTTTADRPRTRAKRQGWKPEGPKPRSGFGSRQPGARGLPPRGCHTSF